MARFDARILEKQLVKRAKIERRFGPKPVKTAILWAQTAWLEAQIEIEDEALVWKRDGRVWRFDAGRVARTQSALEALGRRRALSSQERVRLENRREKLAILAPLAQLETLENAPPRELFLLATQLQSTPQERFCGFRAVVRSRDCDAILRECQNRNSTRPWAIWTAQNAAELRELRGEWPLILACSLGWSVAQLREIWDENPAKNRFQLRESDLKIALENGVSAAKLREIVEICARWEWIWPQFEEIESHFRANTKRGKHRAKWRDHEARARREWFDLWQKIARTQPEALPLALEFHAFWLAQWRLTVPPAHIQNAPHLEFARRLHDAHQTLFRALNELANTPFVERGLRAVFEWAREQIAQNGSRYVSLSRAQWGQILELAPHCDAENLRELWRENCLGVALELREKPYYLALWLEWRHELGEAGTLCQSLLNLPQSVKRAAFLRTRVAQVLAQCRTANPQSRVNWLAIFSARKKWLSTRDFGKSRAHSRRLSCRVARKQTRKNTGILQVMHRVSRRMAPFSAFNRRKWRRFSQFSCAFWSGISIFPMNRKGRNSTIRVLRCFCGWNWPDTAAKARRKLARNCPKSARRSRE